LGILPAFAFGEAFQAAFHYGVPDRNLVELNANFYGNDWTATKYLQPSAPLAERPALAHVDPEKMIAARKAGVSAWNAHERAVAGEFAPAQPYEWRTSF
jgi:hypothetical protein